MGSRGLCSSHTEYVQLVVNYSFDLSATREVSRIKDDADQLSELASGVLGARLVLAGACILVAVTAQIMVGTLRETGWFLWLGLFWFLPGAFRPFWFFLGLERVRSMLAFEMVMMILSVIGVLLAVNSPADVWKVLAVQDAE
jgi:polysaccharide transporter, PST family